MAEPGVAHDVIAVVAGDHEADRAVGGDTEQRLGQRATDVARGVGEHVGTPEFSRVVQQCLIEERQRRRRHHPATAGDAGSDHRGRGDHLRMQPGATDGVADGDGQGDVVLAIEGKSEQARQAQRGTHPRLDRVAEVPSVEAFDQLGEHPVRR